MPVLKNNNDLERWIKNIGADIIERAEDVGRDTKRVRTVSIYALITPDEILNFDITKNYIVDQKEV